MKMKRLLAIILAISLLGILVGCQSGNDKTSAVPKAKWESGDIKAPGDKFNAEKIDATSGGPILAQISKQVNAAQSFTVTGEGFSSAGFEAYISSGEDYKKAAVNVVDDNTAVITAPSGEYGIYSVYLKNSVGTSDNAYINVPKIWWTDLTDKNAGDIFSVYGENLTTDNKNSAHAYLIAEDGKYTEAEINYADPYKISIVVPKGLENDKKYSLKIHNGHGGSLGFAESDEKLIFKSEKINDFSGEVLDVTDFGANPASDNGDDSAAIQAAVDAAADGDILYFPEGVYHFEGFVEIDKNLKITGDGKDKVNLIMGDIENKGMFFVPGLKFEIERVGFWDIRRGNFKSSFINYKGDSTTSGTANLYIHNCRFIQNTDAESLSGTKAISADNAFGIRIENNQFEGTGILLANKLDKVFLNGNYHAGTFYCGQFYGQTSIVLWTTSRLDSNNNKFYAKGEKDAEPSSMRAGDYTSGRMFGIQQYCKNLYIANSESKNSGLYADNAGEQIMLENINSLYDGNLSSGTKNTVTLPEGVNIPIQPGSIVTIVGGKGITQWAYVISQSGTTLNLDHDLAIAPDKSSRVYISRCMDNIAIYRNTFNCFTNYSEAPTATCGIQIYANTHNLFATENTMKNMGYGVCITEFYKYNAATGHTQQRCGTFWSHIDNNRMENLNIGVRYIVETYNGAKQGNEPDAMSFGVTLRNNKISQIQDYTAPVKAGIGGWGMIIGTPDYEYNGWAETCTWSGKCIYAPLIENNSFSDCANANIYLSKHQSGAVIMGNTADNELLTSTAKASKPAIAK